MLVCVFNIFCGVFFEIKGNCNFVKEDLNCELL